MDIQYLSKIGEHTDHVLFIDTSLRDKSRWPTSSEFAVELPNPIRYVTAIEALDVSIPVTMYNVDSHNNTLRLMLRTGGASAFDYETLMPAVRDALGIPGVREAWSAKAAGQDVDLLIAPEGDPAPPYAPLAAIGMLDIAGRARYATLFRQLLGPPARMTAEQKGTFDRQPLPAWTPTLDGSTATLLPTPATCAVVDGGYACQLDSETFLLPAAELDAIDSRWAPSLYTDGAGGATRLVCLVVAYTTEDPAAPDSLFRFFASPEHILSLRTAVVQPGNYDTYAFSTALEAALNDGRAYGTVVMDTPSTVFPKSGGEFMSYDRRVLLRCSLPLFVDCSVSTLGDTLGMSTLALRGSAGYRHLGDAEPARTGATGSAAPAHWARVYCAKPAFERTDDADNQYSVAPDGILYLMGPRVLVLRCIELEASSPLAHASKFSGSLGVIKLYDQTISHLRFDFVKSQRLRFHPIGKLTRITLRFEMVDGSLYDFKGVDFHVMINVSALQPVIGSIAVPDAFPLNPDYDPSLADPSIPVADRPATGRDLERRFQATRMRDKEAESARRNASADGTDTDSDAYYDTTSESEADDPRPRYCGVYRPAG